ncbi:MAG TPA: PAS domain-containing sensor histidine kinase [Ktedonobacteraceae bacterium]|nr:PAS domain-containing sensor histidine kinase [Ktedonobacteraceae bacterium]
MRKRVQKQLSAEQEMMPSIAPGCEASAESYGSDAAEMHSPSGATHSSLHENQYLEAVIASTSDAMITLDPQLCVRDLNSAAVSVLGGAREEIIGRRCSQILCCKNLNRTALCGTSSCPFMRVQQQKKPLPNEELLIGIDPEHACEVSVSVAPVVVDDVAYTVFTARDLSALKVANRVRSNFVSMVSHELRTPLNSVHGFIDLLLQGHMGELTQEQHTYLGYAQEGVQQLVSIVEDILFMTRSDLGQFEIKQQEVHLQSLARQVFRTLQNQAAKAEVVLSSPDVPAHAPPLYADPQRIKQVLSNLVTNAIKFTPPGGTVTVKVRQHNEQFAMISVADTGYGIHPEDLRHIFERFYQSNHSQQSKMGGYGLGLSIAKLIIEQHGGTINVDTAVNQGTTFSFTVPLYRED